MDRLASSSKPVDEVLERAEQIKSIRDEYSQAVLGLLAKTAITDEQFRAAGGLGVSPLKGRLRDLLVDEEAKQCLGAVSPCPVMEPSDG